MLEIARRSEISLVLSCMNQLATYAIFREDIKLGRTSFNLNSIMKGLNSREVLKNEK